MLLWALGPVSLAEPPELKNPKVVPGYLWFDEKGIYFSGSEDTIRYAFGKGKGIPFLSIPSFEVGDVKSYSIKPLDTAKFESIFLTGGLGSNNFVLKKGHSDAALTLIISSSHGSALSASLERAKRSEAPLRLNP
jgi:hypothetical protein